MIGDPPTWLILGGVIAAVIGGIFVGDALGREVRAMIDDDRCRGSKLADETAGDWPAVPDDFHPAPVTEPGHHDHA